MANLRRRGQEALTTARVSAENALMMGEEEAQTAVKVGVGCRSVLIG